MLFLGFALAIAAEIAAWLQVQGQFLIPSWKSNPVPILVTSPIVAYFYWKSNLIFVEATGSYWASYLIFFSIGTVIFAVLTWVFLGESLTAKTVTTSLLAILIVFLQVFWKT